ncbi:unnamed protein product [Cyclocybe aegerita]|uniref:DUF6589 domain-containing protein n=1 Tax=Cyclocybe aegerita TaxID=1973307 RepID=A0A8S0X2C8_CYCAE|nr:unnamed protein product [Cyclocybe aegerita]
MPRLPQEDNLFDNRDLEGNEYPVEDEPDSEPDEPNNAVDIDILDRELPSEDVEDDRNPRTLANVKAVLDKLDELNFKLIDFLDALSWGHSGCTQDAKVRNKRTVMLQDRKLPKILWHWAIPPRRKGSNKKRATGASTVMKEFAVGYIKNFASKELEILVPHLLSDTSEDVRTETLVSTSFLTLASKMQTLAPILWDVLVNFAERPSKRPKAGQTSNNPKTIIMIISVLSYTRSHHRCSLQKLLTLYFQFKGVSAKGFDTLHALGLTMSHKWTADSVKRISEYCMAEVKEMLKHYSWAITYDNINMPLHVFSQRVDNKGQFTSGTAATVYVKPNAQPLEPNANQRLKDRRVEGMANPLTKLDIINLGDDSFPRIRKQMVFEVLKFLISSQEFDLPSYLHKDSEFLKAPPAVDQLPCGPENVALQYLLGTVDIPEASYEDNIRLKEDLKRMSTEQIITWIGDQLTIDRLRNIFKFRAEDENSFERMDFGVLVFGWFHLQMAFANSLHKQYLGTPQMRGLKHAFLLLEKKGLLKVLTKGPFHHGLNEMLHHVAEAHIRLDWEEIAGVTSLADLKDRQPQELYRLAERIVDERASSEAMDKMNARPANQQDEELKQIIMWNRDVLQYIVLEQAMKTGDVGLMEAMLPHLLYRFLGGGNTKYTGEVIELLQALHRELPEDVA